MISPAGNFKFYVASKPVDFRKGMDGLAAIVMNEFDLEARQTLEEWQQDYNWRRPHSALGNLTPIEFLQRKAMDKVAA